MEDLLCYEVLFCDNMIVNDGFLDFVMDEVVL